MASVWTCTVSPVETQGSKGRLTKSPKSNLNHLSDCANSSSQTFFRLVRPWDVFHFHHLPNNWSRLVRLSSVTMIWAWGLRFMWLIFIFIDAFKPNRSKACLSPSPSVKDMPDIINKLNVTKSAEHRLHESAPCEKNASLNKVSSSSAKDAPAAAVPAGSLDRARFGSIWSSSVANLFKEFQHV